MTQEMTFMLVNQFEAEDVWFLVVFKDEWESSKRRRPNYKTMGLDLRLFT